MYIWTVSGLIVLFYNWIILSNCETFQKESQFNYVKISEISRLQQSSEDCIFPPILTISLNFNKSVFEIQVRRNKNSDDVIKPIFVLRNSSSGDPMIIQEDVRRSAFIKIYIDPNTPETSLLMRCTKSVRGQPEVAISGTIVHIGKQFSLTTDRSKQEPFLITEMEPSNPLSHDYRTLPGLKLGDNQNLTHTGVKSGKRPRRQTSIQQPYVIDVLAVIDYSIYKSWYDKSTGNTSQLRDQETKANLRTYFSHFMKEVSIRYQGIEDSDLKIKVKPVGFIVADTQNAYRWTEARKEPGTPREILNADNALKDFKEWIGSSIFLPPHDHAILFTGYDLYTTKDGEKVLHTAGLAYIGSMCRHGGDSVSVVEDHGGFQNVGTATHEIGHSLGAVHDGENNTCNSTNHYIMSSHGIGTAQTNQQRMNQWHFSKCTLNYFKTSISRMLSDGYTCLTESFTDQSVLESTIAPGQIYNPDEQCKLIWGKDSYLCRGSEFGNGSTICTAMYCRDPSTISDCVMHTAARGTSCDNKKWCEEGKCTFSEKAPEKNEQCVLGDQPGIAFINKTCVDLITETPSYCYKAKVRARCCESCAKHYTWVKDCEYGDRVKGCQPYHCNMVSTDKTVMSDCCDTCSYGVKIPTTEQQTYSFSPFTTQPSVTSSSNICVNTALVNGQACSKFIESHGQHICYDGVIQSVCCESCMNVREATRTGCEFGDRHPSFCSNQRNVTRKWCGQYDSYCCKLCDTTSGSSVVVPGVVSILVSFMMVLII